MRISSIALANLRRRRSKAMFLAAGIAIGIGTLVTLLNLNDVLRNEIGHQMDQFGANIVITPNVESLGLDYGGLTVGAVSYGQRQLSTDALERIRNIPYRKRLSGISPKLIADVPVDEKPRLIAGVDFPSERRLKQWWKISGRMPETPDEVLLGFDVARYLSVIDGAPTIVHPSSHHGGGKEAAPETIRIGRDKLEISGRHYHVAGVIHQTGGTDDRVIFASLEQVQRMVDKPGQLSVIEVSALCKDCPIDDIVAQLRAALPSANVAAIQQAVRGRAETLDRITRFSAMVSIVVLALGALTIFTTMTGAVVERTKEIGVLRAIGFRRAHIMQGLLLEVTIVSAAGGLIGWLTGMGASLAVLPYFAESAAQVRVDPILAVFALFLAIATGIVSSVYPVARATRLDPSEALRAI